MSPGRGPAVLGILLTVACGESTTSHAPLRSEPSRLELGTVLVGEAGAGSLNLVNETGQPVFIERFAPDEALDPAVQLVGTPTVLPPDAPTRVDVVFQPSRAGRWVGDLRIDFDRTESRPPLIVPIAGTGVEGELSASPLQLDFGRVRVGAAATATVVIKNRGAASVPVLALPLAPGSSGAFSARLPFISELEPGRETAVEVRFAPTEAGTALGVLLGAGEDRDPLGLEVALRGDGVLGDVEVSPAELEIEGVFVGEVRRRVVRIRNLSFEALSAIWTLTSTLGAADLRLEGPGEAFLQPGETADVELVFEPRSPGARAATLEVRTPRDRLEVSVLAEAAVASGPRPRLAAEVLDFGRVSLGHISERWLQVELDGNLALPASARFEALPAGGPFSWLEAAGSILPGDLRRLSVRFSPVVPGLFEGVLWVGTASRAVTGVGVPGPIAELEAWPPRVDFGRIPRETEALRSLRIYSRGTEPPEGVRAEIAGPFELDTGIPARWPRVGAELRVRHVDDGGAPGPREGRLRLLFEGGIPLEIPLVAELRSLPTPRPQLEVSLRWSGEANLDLHLSLDGADIYDAPRSVSFCHPQSNWGESGVEDDPWLDADAGGARGVERIRIDVNRASRYRIDVTHRDGAPVTAEIEVQVVGVQAARSQRLLSTGRRWTAGALTFSESRASFDIDPRPLTIETRTECD